jgi:hypothetical protein
MIVEMIFSCRGLVATTMPLSENTLIAFAVVSPMAKQVVSAGILLTEKKLDTALGLKNIRPS